MSKRLPNIKAEQFTPEFLVLESVILAAMKAFRGKEIHSPISRTFLTPQQWAKRKEPYAENAIMVVIHDDYDVGPFFSYDAMDYEALEFMQKVLEQLGFYSEQGTAWYSGIYRI
jgi:hypothetical protein